MGLAIGLVGLPNVGKSTTFNALTKTQNAEAANYPFCTIEPNKAIVPVPDARMEALAAIVKPERMQYSTIEFVDIAGLVKGASRGEGLGNKFLGNIKETEVILQIVRCFEDGNIVHTEGSVNPLRDVEIIETELILADMESLSNRMTRMERMAKADKKAKEVYDFAATMLAHLNEGKMLSTFGDKSHEAFVQLNQELRFLTNKVMMYGANVDEAGLLEDNEHVQALQNHAQNIGADVIKLCAKIEEELGGMEEEERQEFLTDMGVLESGLDQIIRKGFDKLGLMSYFTAGVKEVRAWTIHKGTTAPKAAAVIHNDFERGFIRAEVIAYDDYVKYKGEAGAKEAGKLRLEGKEYIVQDGDVMHFRFNV
ncbi:MAG: GTP-binding protein [Sulfuricurvum sp. PC08-66]|nr:MAG: GTP-binding protein [Sulfuricurvum sp. PC08-66]